MKQLIIKDRFVNANDQSPKIVVLLPPSFCVKAFFHKEDKTLRLALYDGRSKYWRDSLIYEPIITISDNVVANLDAVKSESDISRVICMTVEDIFIKDVASFISEGLTPDTLYADKPYLDFAFFEDHVNKLLEAFFAQQNEPKPKK